MVERLTIEWIVERVEHGQYILTRHAEVERRNDALCIAELAGVHHRGYAGYGVAQAA